MSHSIIIKTVKRIQELLLQGSSVIVAWSGGKDSSALLNCTLHAALCAKQEGIALPPIFVTMSDTGVENPEIHLYCQQEIRKIKEYATACDLPVSVHIAHPSILDRWIVKTIGKRSLPTFADSRKRECANDMKVVPQQRLRKKLLSSLQGYADPVILIGTRFDESAARSANMAKRGDSSTEIRESSGEYYLAPLANWSHDDVWCYLAECAAGNYPSYSDFRETVRIYTESSGEG